MLEVVRTVAADLLEAPEEAVKLTGQALSVIGDELQKMAARIDKLEQMVSGRSDTAQG